MSTIKSIASLYASSLPEKQKKQLLDIYKEYVKSSRVFEHIFKKRGTRNIASYQLDFINNEEDSQYFPWKISDCTSQEKEYYKDFTSGVIGTFNYDCPHYSFVSVETIHQKTEERNTIHGAPTNYKLIGSNNLLPNFVERFILTFKEDEKFEDLKYIINGKYKATYVGIQEFDSAMDSLSNKSFVSNLSCLLGLVARLPDQNLSDLEQKQVTSIGFETLASEFSIPYEQVMLGMQANLTEKTHKIIKDIYSKRYIDSYMKKAQEDGLIRSASEFQDLINIRHLISHQLETLEGFGRFTNGEDNQNKSLRERYLASYNRIYDKTLIKRIDKYVELSDTYKLLVEGLIPNLFIRDSQESNNKFISRLKNYRKDNPNTQLIIEMNYPHANDKKDALQKNIKKLFPEAEIIDDLSNFKQDEAFLDRITAYNMRTIYLTTFQELEREISEYCLYNGMNCSPKEGWKIISQRKILTHKEDKRITEFKILRNELSHEVFDDELTQKLMTDFDDFKFHAEQLKSKIAALRPNNLAHVKDNIYKVIHKDGREFLIDIVEKKAIQDNTDTTQQTKNKHYTPKGDYTEEYENGCAVSLKGTKIQSIRTPDGFILDINKKTLTLTDGCKIYFNGKDINSLSLGKYKIITDKTYKIKNLMFEGKSINIEKQESINLGSNLTLKTNKDLQISELSVLGNKKNKIKIMFHINQDTYIIKFSNGLQWNIKDNIITNKNQELNYLDREKFANSFDISTDTIIKDPNIR